MKKAYSVLLRKTEGKKPLEKPWRRWENNIRKELRERECEIGSG
jgi:hypothetical protein